MVNWRTVLKQHTACRLTASWWTKSSRVSWLPRRLHCQPICPSGSHWPPCRWSVVCLSSAHLRRSRQSHVAASCPSLWATEVCSRRHAVRGTRCPAGGRTTWRTAGSWWAGAGGACRAWRSRPCRTAPSGAATAAGRSRRARRPTDRCWAAWTTTRSSGARGTATDSCTWTAPPPAARTGASTASPSYLDCTAQPPTPTHHNVTISDRPTLQHYRRTSVSGLYSQCRNY